jgi:alpha-glucosidase
VSRPTSPREGVIYQIYPRSFADGDGDGIGDLLGLRERLGYLLELGVDSLWLNPISPSGGVDGGYDVADYTEVDAAYGGLDALDRLLAEAHRAGLRVLLDFVPNHTSDRHPWFVEARSSRGSPKRSWYVFADGLSGSPPNDWLSGFGGSAWVAEPESGQFYLAGFYSEQPELNWDTPEVRTAVIEAMRFWVDRGVDGFRIDVVHRLSKDPLLRDNLVASAAQPPHDQKGSVPRFDENGPRIHDYVREIREGVGGGSLLLGEVWMLELQEVARFLGPGELDLAFNFPFATAPWDPEAMAAAVDEAARLFVGPGAPAYHLSNHDVSRHATRFGDRAIRPAAVLLLTLPGSPVLYYGEEVGMTDGQVPTQQRYDRFGRDPCRTPMQWDPSGNAGFCPPGVDPWLPVAGGFERRTVAVQRDDPDSVLSLYRRLIAVRKESPALRVGSYRRIDAPSGCLAYVRERGDDRFLVAVNFTSSELAVPGATGSVVAATSLRREGLPVESEVVLNGDEALVIRLLA